MKKFYKLSLIILFTVQSVFANTGTDADLKVFDGFWENVNDSFTGSNLFFHAAGVLSTAILAKSGIDAHVHDSFRHNSNNWAWPGAIAASGAGALIAVSSLYFSGVRDKNKESIGAAFAITQAATITFSYVVLLKIITGRSHPVNSHHMTTQEQAEDFNFGFMKNGVTAYGWPSGHVAHTVSITSALAHYYPAKPWLKWLSVGLSSYMLYTVSAHDWGQMHWFSDGVAGAFMGYTVGSSVGKNLRFRLDGTTQPASSITWLPVIGPNYVGAMAGSSF